jgi:hypothetical protein
MVALGVAAGGGGGARVRCVCRSRDFLTGGAYVFAANF